MTRNDRLDRNDTAMRFHTLQVTRGTEVAVRAEAACPESAVGGPRRGYERERDDRENREETRRDHDTAPPD
jgi:hypothetical protein